jgi:hypothetical protein
MNWKGRLRAAFSFARGGHARFALFEQTGVRMNFTAAIRNASRFALLPAFAALLLSACVHHHVVMAPSSPSSPQLAVLELGQKGGMVEVETFDGKTIQAEATVRELRFSPGRHTVEGHVLTNGLSTPFSITREFGPGSRSKVSARQNKGYEVEAILERAVH